MRVYGFEVEYAVAWLPIGRSPAMTHDEVADELFARVKQWGGGQDIFLPNGGRLYIDTGAHPEYATPECLSIEELVTHDRAGDLLMRQLAKMAEQRLGEKGRDGRMFVLRNNTDEYGNSWGCHENLLVRRSVPLERLVGVLAPYMATRPIWAGAGGLDNTSYVFSPRIKFIEEQSGTSTSQARPLVNLRDESHASPEFRRLHLLAGDTNMSEMVNYTKMGVSGAILSMLERNRRLPELPIDSVTFMRDIASDFNFTRKVTIPTGQAVSALDIQEMFCEAVEAEMERGNFDDEISQAVRMWRGVLDGLRRKDWDYLETRLDWVRKKMLIDTLVSTKHISRDDPRVKYLDYIYHAVDERNAAYANLHKLHPAVTLTTVAAAKEALSKPPAGRAKARGQFVSEVLSSGRAAIIDWERWGYEHADEMWEILDPTSEDPGEPILKTPALWESKSSVRSQRRMAST